MIRVLRRCCVASVLVFASATVSPAASQNSADVATVRAELDRLYAVNAEAFMRGDVRALMELRSDGFHLGDAARNLAPSAQPMVVVARGSSAQPAAPS